MSQHTSTDANSSQLSLTSTLIEPTSSHPSLSKSHDVCKDSLEASGSPASDLTSSRKNHKLENMSRDEVAAELLNQYGYGFAMAPTPMLKSEKVKVNKKEKDRVSSVQEASSKEQVANDLISKYGLTGSFAPTPLLSSAGSSSNSSPKAAWRKLFNTRET